MVATDLARLLRQIEGAGSRDDLRKPLQDVALAAADGDQAATDGLLWAVDSQRLAFPALRRLLFNPDDQDEVAQDVLVAVARSISTFRGDAHFLSWLHTVATNNAMAFLRRKQDVVGLERAETSWSARFTSIATTKGAVRDAIGQLPDVYREAVTLRDLEQLTYKEVAAQLDLNLNTTRARIARGRSMVATTLGGTIAALQHGIPTDTAAGSDGADG